MTPARVLASEATKLSGLGWLPWLLLGTVAGCGVVTVGLGLLVRAGAGASAVSVVTSGYPVAEMGLLCLGVLVGAGDFSTGSAASTYVAVPRRLPVLGAQVVLTTVLSVATGSLALAVSVLTTAGARERAGLDLDLSAAATAGAAGFVLHVTGVALLGLGLAALVRHPGAALVVPVVLLVLVDPLLAANAGPVVDVVRSLLPAAGTAMFLDAGAPGTGDAGPGAAPVQGGLALAGWVAAATAAAAIRLCARDVS